VLNRAFEILWGFTIACKELGNKRHAGIDNRSGLGPHCLDFVSPKLHNSP